jgi:hypothetical protein
MNRTKRKIPVLLATAILLFGTALHAQTLDDICGCKGHAKAVKAFSLYDDKTWPAGSRQEHNNIYIPLPPDGVLVYEEFKADRKEGDHGSWQIHFERNADNTPVRLLVAGDFLLGSYVTMQVQGNDGARGDRNIFGRGGMPGPGGFRGADGAYQEVNDASLGGVGLGPAGGEPGKTEPLEHAKAGGFSGNRELRPLVGGSGGGGGVSKDKGNCSGGGGGGGGGAILVAANGRLDIKGHINADGGHGGGHSNGDCSTNGGPGGGGAIRLVATQVAGEGYLSARGNRGSRDGLNGIIRIESVEEAQFHAHRADPPAVRTQVIAPLADPAASQVRITAVGGQSAPPKREDKETAVEILLAKPGKTAVQVQTRGVPAGTTVEVTMKAKAGGQLLRQRGELNPKNCKSGGDCTLVLDFDLPGGTWFAEAMATFQVP